MNEATSKQGRKRVRCTTASLIIVAPLICNEAFNIVIDQNGTEPWSPIYLSRRFDDWSIPAGCILSMEEAGAGNIGGATIGVTSATSSQAASIFALSSTVALNTETSSSSTPTPTPSTTPISSPASTVPSAPSTPTPTGPIDTTATGADNSGGLSAGAKAGIGAGVAVGALLVAVAAYVFYRNHRKMKDMNTRMSYQPEAEAQQYEKPPGVTVAHHAVDGDTKPYNNAPTWSQELPSPHVPPSELAATR
ncbi:hypothetical protein BKA58DRAFT_36730 [Alternaria rosae]|uniref:uncharacterized protein n=1 Tax=Alternaria rosae TaxID=1187941 RepID=UPI001E8ED5DE|nr:uncharacterized protein BKA58DRAFT_36730 [Alternaria rosae]KAH6860610.1 hypothetical protein BKA58DRAFT_36730 [Alternaria rosae]